MVKQIDQSIDFICADVSSFKHQKKKMMIGSKLLSIYVVGQPLNRWVKKISPISDPSTFFVIKTSKGIDKKHRNSKVV